MDKPDKINCDVLVIGGGGAGLAAAIEARATSAYVVLVEKNPELGGTTAWSIGSFIYISVASIKLADKLGLCMYVDSLLYLASS